MKVVSKIIHSVYLKESKNFSIQIQIRIQSPNKITGFYIFYKIEMVSNIDAIVNKLQSRDGERVVHLDVQASSCHTHTNENSNTI